jgi:hypothetical protein
LFIIKYEKYLLKNKLHYIFRSKATERQREETKQFLNASVKYMYADMKYGMSHTKADGVTAMSS